MINKLRYSKIIYLIITLVIILIIVFTIIHFSNNKALSDTTDILDVSGNPGGLEPTNRYVGGSYVSDRPTEGT